MPESGCSAERYSSGSCRTKSEKCCGEISASQRSQRVSKAEEDLQGRQLTHVGKRRVGQRADFVVTQVSEMKDHNMTVKSR